MEHASVFSGQAAGELMWAARELGVGEAFQVGRLEEEGSLSTAETERAVEATLSTTELVFENWALLLN